jgi:hypothetical protein
MEPDGQFDDSIGRWLEATAPPPLSERALDATFKRTRRSRQHVGFRALLGRIHMTRSVFALGGAVVVVIAAALAFNFDGDRAGVGGAATQPPTASPSPAPITSPLPAEQTAVIARQVVALNSRDAEAFIEIFADDGAFNPRGTFASSYGLFSNTQPVANRSLVESFMAINEAWRFEAEVVACDQLSKSEYARRYGLHYDTGDSFGHCAIKSRWPTLSLELGEWWGYEFKGTNILWWSQRVRDAAPADRTLPLGLEGLLQWESWLGRTNSDAAARLLNPRVFPVTVPCSSGPVFVGEGHTTTAPPEPPCTWSSDDVDVERITSDGNGRGDRDWVVAGQNFAPSALIPYDPTVADEIRASIEEFLRR